MTALAGEVTGADVLRRPDRLYDGYVFDLDGTLYLGDALLPGAADLVHALRARGRRTLFLSNNATRDPDMYAEKLTRLGIPTDVADVVNPVVTMRAWLLAHHPDDGVFVIGEEPLRRALADAGLRLTDDPADIGVVVASYDRTFDYRKLQVAFDALWLHRTARLVTTNPDAYCPMPGGRGEPDAAAVVAAIEACTGARCEVNVGKPSPVMLDAALAPTGLTPSQCLMVGDRLGTDVAMAVAAGMDAAAVLTGETTVAMLAACPVEHAPTWVVERVDHLLPDGSDGGTA